MAREKKFELSVKLDERLWHWAGWCIKYHFNEVGWPEESPLYKFQREGFTSNKNTSRGSSTLYNPHPEADEVNGAFNVLKTEDHAKAEILYYFYVHHISVRRMAMIMQVHHRTLYKRLDAARNFIAERISL